MQVQGEVRIAQPKPGLAAEPLQRLHEPPGLVLAAPSGDRVGDFGQRVRERVHVGRDVQTPVFEVVAGVDHEYDIPGGQQLGKAEGELRPAHTAGQRQYGHRNRSSLSGRGMADAGCSDPSAWSPRINAAGVRSVVSPMASVAALAKLSARLIKVTLSSRP